MQQRARKPNAIDDILALHRTDPTFLPECDLPLTALLPLFAGVETVGSIGACMLYVVLKDPALRERAQAEADALFAGGTPDAAQVRELDVLYRIMLEALRMYTPVPGIQRKVTTSFDFAGHRIPAGEDLFLAFFVTHDLPEHFPDPRRFDMDRYLPGREEQQAAWSVRAFRRRRAPLRRPRVRRNATAAACRDPAARGRHGAGSANL